MEVELVANAADELLQVFLPDERHRAAAPTGARQSRAERAVLPRKANRSFARASVRGEGNLPADVSELVEFTAAAIVQSRAAVVALVHQFAQRFEPVVRLRIADFFEEQDPVGFAEHVLHAFAQLELLLCKDAHAQVSDENVRRLTSVDVRPETCADQFVDGDVEQAGDFVERVRHLVQRVERELLQLVDRAAERRLQFDRLADRAPVEAFGVREDLHGRVGAHVRHRAKVPAWRGDIRTRGC